MLAFRPVTSLVGITSTFFERNTMPDGLVRTGDFRKGSPITLPHDFGNDVDWQTPDPAHFGNPVDWQPSPEHFGNPVTWQTPNPAHFGNPISNTPPPPPITQLSTPVATPAGGSYTGAQSVTLAVDAHATATYYTTDGSTPTTGSTLYTGAITTTGSGTEVIKAFSHGTGSYSDSAVLTATYVITPVVVVPQLQAHATAATSGFGSASLATAGIDTTDATFLAAYLEGYYGPSAYPFALVDSYGNEWVGLSIATENHTGQLFYSYQKIGGGACVVGPGHTFTLTQPGVPFLVATMYVEAFSGVQTSSDPLEGGSDQILYGGYTGISETPANTGDLIVMGASGYNFTLPVSIDSGFTVTDDNQATGGAGESGAMAYLIAPSTSAVDPTWTTSAGISGTINGAVFAHA
jgi:hypothetical protein